MLSLLVFLQYGKRFLNFAFILGYLLSNVKDL